MAKSPESKPLPLNMADDPYLQLCLCYPACGHTCSFVIRQLENGIANLTELLPWVADANGTIPIVSSLACRPIFSEILETGFPFSILDEEAISPLPTFGNEPLLLQINFIPDGLGLVFCARRSIMDISRMGLVLGLLHKLCTNEEISAEELAAAKSNHTLAELPTPPMSAVLDTDTKVGTAVNNEAKSDTEGAEPQEIELAVAALHSAGSAGISPPLTPPALGKARWFYFALPLPSSLTDHSGPLEDLVTAFVFKAVISVRYARNKWPRSKTVVLARASRPRMHHNISTENANATLYTTYTLSHILDSSVAELSSTVGSLSASIIRPDVDTYSEVMLSSWLHVSSYNWTFGISSPSAVRFLPSAQLPGVGLILPLDPNAAAPVIGFCLEDEDLNILRASPLFKENAIYIG